jgi:hypothetical protein
MDPDALAERWRTFDVPANIYRVDPAVEPLDDVRQLAERAGLTRAADSEWTQFGPLLELQEEPYTLTLYRPSRGIQWVDSGRWQMDDGVSTMDVSDEQAVAAALREVESLRLAGDDEFRPFKVARLNVATAEKGGDRYETRVIDVGVVLTRVLDGLEVEGQGGSIVMYLDTELRPTGFERVARRIADVHEPVRQWRPMEDVLSEVEGYWRRSRDDGLTVADVRLGYLELGRLQPQEYIQPAFALSLRLSDAENGEARTVEHYVAAAANRIGTLMADDPGPQGQLRYGS